MELTTIWLTVLVLVGGWNAYLRLWAPTYNALDEMGAVDLTAERWHVWERYTQDQLLEVTAAERARARERIAQADRRPKLLRMR